MKRKNNMLKNTLIKTTQKNVDSFINRNNTTMREKFIALQSMKKIIDMQYRIVTDSIKNHPDLFSDDFEVNVIHRSAYEVKATAFRKITLIKK